MLFEFNMYSALLLPGFIQGALFTLLLFWRGWRKQQLSDHLLAIILLISTLHVTSYMLGFAGWYDAHNGYTTFMFYFPWTHVLWFGPFIYLYFRSLTNTRFQLERRYFWILLPGAIELTTRVVIFLHDLAVRHWLLGEELPYFHATKGWWRDFSLPVLDSLVFALAWNFVFLLLTIREYGRYKRYVRNNFSDTEEIEFSWLRKLLIGFVVVLSLMYLFRLFDAYIQELHYTQNWFSFFAVSVWIYYLSIAGYTSGEHIPIALQYAPEDAPPPASPSTDDQEAKEIGDWKNKIKKWMAEQRPYLNPELTLPEMAGQLGAGASLLSRVINQGFGQNFNDFINAHRVEAVKAKLTKGENEQYTLLAIAMECGFNSKATFNRAFRKFTGMSPREFQRQNQHNQKKE